MSASGRDALGDIRDRSGDPLGCPGVAEAPSGMSGSGRESLQDAGSGRETPRMSGSGREALPDIR